MFGRLLFAVAASLLITAVNAAPCADDKASGCRHSPLQVAEAELDTLYSQLLAQLGEGSARHKRLVNAQRTWHSFREAECEYVTTYGEHKGQHSQNYELCAQAMTEQRIQALHQYQQCGAPGESCQVAAP